jgi:two-component system response regulator AtoC
VVRILIVDDQELVRFVMERALEKLDASCDMVAASGAEEALEALTDQAFDLIMTDLRMPDMDGIELTERIRARGIEAAVVWITAYGCAKYSAEGERLGVHRCVEKPIEVGLIREVARDALEGRLRDDDS